MLIANQTSTMEMARCATARSRFTVEINAKSLLWFPQKWPEPLPWNYPGMVDSNEDPLDTAKRELGRDRLFATWFAAARDGGPPSRKVDAGVLDARFRH
jgi:hypothetical protein